MNVSWAVRVASLYQRLLHRLQAEEELDREVQAYFEILVERYMARGLSREEARRAVRIESEGAEQVKQKVREARMGAGIESTFQDIRYACRVLQKNPGFMAIAVLTLALGVGASTAIFSVTNAVLLRPLPYTDPGRLVLAWEERGKLRDLPFFDADFFDLRNGAKNTFEDVAAVNGYLGILPREDGTSDQVRFVNVTTNFFRLMGARIAFGRDFVDRDGQPQPPSVTDPSYDPHLPMRNATSQATQRWPTMAIISYEFWQRRYGGNTAVLGRTMGNAQIVGVLAPHFELLFPSDLDVDRTPDVYTAARLTYNRDGAILRPVGRLKAGVTLAHAQAEAQALTSGFEIRLEPLHKHLVAEVRPAILALMGAVIFLLLISCANVANLLLVRVSLRERDLAMRTALGGNWWRLMRQMLAEAVMLSGLSTLLGVSFAWIGIRVLLVIAPANLPRIESISIDPRVVAYAAITGLATAIIFGLAPAMRGARPDVMQILRGGGRTVGPRAGGLLQNCVVIAEVALAFVLLIGSGLMFRSFLELQRIDPGYDPRGLLTFGLQSSRLLLNSTQPPQRAALMREIYDRLNALPGVKRVAACAFLPLGGGPRFQLPWGLDQAQMDQGKFQLADPQIVLPGYFETLHTRLIAGRTFTENDNVPGRNVVVIDDLFATKTFPNESAVGKRILIPRWDGPGWERVEVIGVVAHQRIASLAELGREQIYLADGFPGNGVARQWVIRTAGNPTKYAAAVRAEITKLDSHILILGVQPMEALVDREQAGTRFSLLLIGAFAVISALLAAVGLYGVLSTVVQQRAAEIGVRMALGATPAGVFKLVVGQGLRLSMAGIAIGLFAAFGLTRVMTSMLVGVKPTDPSTFAAISVLFFLIAAVASWMPAQRAAGIDPTAALREE
jgi:predicted permease